MWLKVNIYKILKNYLKGLDIIFQQIGRISINQEQIQLNLNEVYWANVFYDSIKGIIWGEKLYIASRSSNPWGEKLQSCIYLA